MELPFSSWLDVTKLFLVEICYILLPAAHISWRGEKNHLVLNAVVSCVLLRLPQDIVQHAESCKITLNTATSVWMSRYFAACLRPLLN